MNRQPFKQHPCFIKSYVPCHFSIAKVFMLSTHSHLYYQTLWTGFGIVLIPRVTFHCEMREKHAIFYKDMI